MARLRARLPEGPPASAGAAYLPGDGTTPGELLGEADRRLYTDKRSARGV
jgi:GGDEF domain-containing protein